MSVLLYEKKGKVAYITFNRPQAFNAFNNQLKTELAKTWANFRDDPEVWVAIITGAGDKAFSAGSDIKEFADLYVADRVSYQEHDALSTGKIELFKPLIAAINGWCIGAGLDLALCCDIRIATENSRFGLVEPKIGRFAGDGGTMRLPKQIPFAIAMEMLLTGDTIDARRAYEIGLVNQVVSSKEELLPAAEKMAERILACAPLGVRASKELALRTFDVPLNIELRLDIGAEARQSQDAKEGSAAFAQKRKPTWTGK